MTSCIITVIKDEHFYLDEFLSYHLNLGINHIFVIEDCISKTHKNITDKYNNVTLYNVLDLWDTNEEKKYIYSRKIHRFKMQNTYLKKAYWFIKSHYDYDWMFAIDCDEYITLNDSYTLDDIFRQFNSYDAVILRWQNYGANGLIYKPDYSKQKIVDTYTKKIGYQTRTDTDKYTIKTLYNLKRYTNDFYFSMHRPKDTVANWCMTDFSQDYSHYLFDKIYIRHYITKSWEDYIIKLKVRGMFYRRHRTYDSFFDMNPDMLDKKEELIKISDDIINKHIYKRENN